MNKAFEVLDTIRQFIALLVVLLIFPMHFEYPQLETAILWLAISYVAVGMITVIVDIVTDSAQYDEEEE